MKAPILDTHSNLPWWNSRKNTVWICRLVKAFSFYCWASAHSLLFTSVLIISVVPQFIRIRAGNLANSYRLHFSHLLKSFKIFLSVVLQAKSKVRVIFTRLKNWYKLFSLKDIGCLMQCFSTAGTRPVRGLLTGTWTIFETIKLTKLSINKISSSL